MGQYLSKEIKEHVKGAPDRNFSVIISEAPYESRVPLASLDHTRNPDRHKNN